MSCFNFSELFYSFEEEKIKRYYQPRFLFGGRSFLNLDSALDNPNFQDKLKESFKIVIEKNDLIAG